MEEFGLKQPWVASSGFGGDFAKQLKFAGYDAILLVGQAPSLTYLYIEDGHAELLQRRQITDADGPGVVFE